jgi:hypothetical protein
VLALQRFGTGLGPCTRALTRYPHRVCLSQVFGCASGAPIDDFEGYKSRVSNVASGS